MDSLIEEFEKRFFALGQVCSQFQFLWGKTPSGAKEEDFEDFVKIFGEKYPEDAYRT